MPKVLVRGVEHYYQWICSLDQKLDPNLSDFTPQKPVLVFLHGWGGSARYWETTALALADQFDCLLYDLRGFGRSSGSGMPATSDHYALRHYAEDLAALLDALQLSQVSINAHSMGASIATLFLNQYPERVERAILTCSGIFAYEERAFKAFHTFGKVVVQFRPAWLQRIPFADRLFMARFLHRPLPTAISQIFLRDFLEADYDAALGTVYTSVSEHAALSMPLEFQRLQVPVLLVAGEFDQIIPADMGRKAAELSDQVKFTLIPATSHFPMLEDPETYLQQVRAFLK
jgi:proline iminopeptidase